MSEEPTHYNKYEVSLLLKIEDDAFKMERIFDVYKQLDSKHFYYNILQSVSFPKAVDSQTFNVYNTNVSDTWPVISYKHYDRIDLWWIIAAFNNIDDAFTPLPPGSRIKVPTPSTIRYIIDRIKEQV